MNKDNNEDDFDEMMKEKNINKFKNNKKKWK